MSGSKQTSSLPVLTRRGFLAGVGAGAASLTAAPAFAGVPPDPDVVVIGAGAAGLGATRTLLDMGIPVALIEARERIGGRAHTEWETFGVAYDHGCHWLHVAHLNPWVDFAKANGYAVYPARDDYTVYIDGQREATADEYAALERTYDRIYGAIGQAGRANRDVSPASVVSVEGPWEPLCEAWIGPWDMGKDFDHFSCQDWWSFPDGADWFCKQGFGTLVAHYGADIPVRLNTPATRVRWGGPGVEVETPAGTIRAKIAIVTVSTGVLAAEVLAFDPPLSAEKQDAFHRISMGTFNNIALQFSDDIFGLGADAYVDRRVESTAAAGWLTNIAGTNLSFGYTGGRHGRELEKAGVEAAVDFGLGELRKILGSSIDAKFVKGSFSRWGEDPWTLGSYASAEPGYTNMRNQLRSPVAEKIYFAGEACSGNLWATAAGALENGILAAQRVRWALAD